MTDSYNTGRGFAFVTFSSAAEVRSGVHIIVANDLQATAAIAAMDGQEVCGREIQCNLAKPKKVEGLGGGRGGGAGPDLRDGRAGLTSPCSSSWPPSSPPGPPSSGYSRPSPSSLPGSGSSPFSSLPRPLSYTVSREQ